MWRILQLALLFTAVLAKTYNGYNVYRVFPQDESHVKWLSNVADSDLEIELWSESIRGPHSNVDMLVSPDNIPVFTGKMKDLGLPWKVLWRDVQTIIDDTMAANKERKDAAPFYDFTYYMDWEEMQAWVAGKVEECGARCTLINIGSSYEGSDLPVVRIEASAGASSRQEKNDIWLDAGIHAREWIAHSTGNYFIERLIDDYGTDPFVTTLLDKYNVYIMPNVNPDGYVYSWTDDRMWRKTRKPSSEACYGSDANRNFDFMWNTVGTSQNPCANTYPGGEAFSEPEARAVGDFIQNVSNADFLVYMTLHTYGQMWMFPYGYTCDRVPDYDELTRVAERATTALTAVYGTEYVYGNVCETLYENSGTSRDWSRGVMNIDYVYTLELRDQNSFVLPPEEILPTGIETWAGFQEMVVAIEENQP